MKPIRLIAQNFLVFEKFDYVFENKVIALIGENRTQLDQGSNGSGKSTISQMMYYAIVGSSMRDKLDKKLIRKGQKSTFVALELACVIRNQVLRIERTLPLKGSSQVELFLNDEQITSLATVDDKNKYIVDWIGISVKDLKSYYIVCKEYYQSFFKASNTEKLALISRFINFSNIDKTKVIIQEKINEITKEKRDLELRKSNIEGKIEALSTQIEDELKRDLVQEKQDVIDSLYKEIELKKQKITTYREAIVNFDKQCEDIVTNIAIQKKQLKQNDELLDEIPNCEESEEVLSEIEKELIQSDLSQSKIEKLLTQTKDNKGRLQSQLRTTEVNLSGVIVCPKCHHNFLNDENISIEEETKKKSDLLKEILSVEQKEKKTEKEREEIQDIRKEWIESKKELEKEIYEIQKLSKEIQTKKVDIERKIKALEADRLNLLDRKTKGEETITNHLETIELHLREIENVKKRDIVDIDVSGLRKKVDELREEILIVNERINEKNTNVFSQEQWISRFKSFKMYLASEQIKNIQISANHILKKEQSDLRLLMDGFKLDSKGNTKEEITTYIVRDEPESFWYYSGGERARVEIALIVALQQMINSTNPYGGFEFISIDEITEGLSEEGLYHVIETMDFINYPVLIATHIVNSSDKCATLKIVKENGIGRIEL